MEKGIVIDASALLAIYFKEPAADWIAARLADHPVRLMSPLTLTEVLIRVRDKAPSSFDDVYRELLGGRVQFIPMDTAQAVIAARARHLYPLNLGDCVVYALAKSTGATILTLDKDFRGCDVPVLLPD